VALSDTLLSALQNTVAGLLVLDGVLTLSMCIAPHTAVPALPNALNALLLVQSSKAVLVRGCIYIVSFDN
jgi:hypothetical protein